jgi:23S rRNA (uracil1939-C5)-methyltransferase
VLAGFRERDKPYVADIKRCEIMLEQFALLPQYLAALVETLSMREDVPQVEVAAGDGDGLAAALVFRLMQTPGAGDLEKLAGFGAQHGVQIFLQTGGLDSIRPLRDDYPPLAYGVSDTLSVEFGPVDFIQVNRDVNRSMIATAMELLQPTPADRVLDLFCGLGNFTLPAAVRAKHVVGVEGDSTLVAKAQANAARNGVGNAEFHVDNLFEPDPRAAWIDGRYDLVLLDPPRAGAMQIMERMPHWGPRRVVYISCHPGSLARDAGILVHTSGFELSGAGVMDMFPHTTHVESIAIFERGP